MYTEIEIAKDLIIKDFELDEPGVLFSSLKSLRVWLTKEIEILIDRDFQHLMNYLCLHLKDR